MGSCRQTRKMVLEEGPPHLSLPQLLMSSNQNMKAISAIIGKDRIEAGAPATADKDGSPTEGASVRQQKTKTAIRWEHKQLAAEEKSTPMGWVKR